MKTASCKAKGRRLQKKVAEDLQNLGQNYGLQPGDVRPVSMGVSGVDVILSPKAKDVLGPLTIECKNQEALNVYKTFSDHMEKYEGDRPILVHSKNRGSVLVTMAWGTFLYYLGQELAYCDYYERTERDMAS